MGSNSPEWQSESEFPLRDEINQNVNTENSDKQEQVKERPSA